MHITLREWNSNPFFIELKLYRPGNIPVDLPIIAGIDPRSNRQVYGGISQLMNLDQGRRIIMPEAKLDSVSCNAKPITKPAIPKPVSIGASDNPICESAIKTPMT